MKPYRMTVMLGEEWIGMNERVLIAEESPDVLLLRF